MLYSNFLQYKKISTLLMQHKISGISLSKSLCFPGLVTLLFTCLLFEICETYLKNHRNSVLVTGFGCLNSLKYADLLMWNTLPYGWMCKYFA